MEKRKGLVSLVVLSSLGDCGPNQDYNESFLETEKKSKKASFDSTEQIPGVRSDGVQ